MKQYLPLKPTKRGFKVWVVADSGNGYFLDLQVYVGKEGSAVEYGLGERVVLQLSEKYRAKGHRLFCDNFFTSPRLFLTFLDHNIYACGTVRQSRVDYPTDLRHLSLQVGDHHFRQSHSLTAVVWQDKRPVHVLSTLSQPGATEMVSRRQRDGSRAPVSCPSAIATYTKYMSCVDCGDQLRRYYSVRLKCNKNYKYIFWFAFNVCITNAHILSSFVPSCVESLEQERLKNFCVRLAKSLIGNYNSRQRRRRCHSHHTLTRPVSVPHNFHSPHHHSRRRCDYCREYRHPPRRRESVWQCLRCEGTPTLCLTGRDDGSDCWSLWHREE